MSYWKSKVLPKLKKFFDKGKRKGASEVCKTFDKSKESLDKEFEEKGSDLNPKVVEIYRSSSTFISKKLLKEPNEATVKENPDAVQSVLEELVKAGFPGAQVICDAGTKYGPALLPGPVVYLFEKASVFLVGEELPEEPKPDETREVKVEDLKPAEAAGEPEVPPPVTIESEVPAIPPVGTDEVKAAPAEPVVEGEGCKEERKEEEAAASTTEMTPAVEAAASAPVETPAAVETPARADAASAPAAAE